MSSNQNKKTYAFGDLQDGTEWSGIRVTLTDQLQYERTATANKWSREHVARAYAFLSWHASRRAGVHTLGWDEFLKEALEASLTEDAPEDTDADTGSGDELGPTIPAASTATP